MIALLPAWVLLAVWDQLPPEIPLRWDLVGNVKATGAKETLWALPLTTLFAIGLMVYLPRFEKPERIAVVGPILERIGYGVGIFMTVLLLIILGSATGRTFEPIRLILGSVAVFMGFIGNYFGKLRPNHLVGIRTPLTLNDETNWVKTHRFAGKLWVGGSAILVVLMALLSLPACGPVFLSTIGIMVAVPIVYSYRLGKLEA